mmetsp:Transcript_16128/g.56232  ORF Transcript_16128/g.56232 Transcript_16128/m.56232 type:complete len:242 (-) Transcript_16128:1262-1987(-)
MQDEGGFVSTRSRTAARRDRRDPLHVGIGAEILEQESAEAVLALSRRRSPQFNVVNAHTALHRTAKLGAVWGPEGCRVSVPLESVKCLVEVTIGLLRAACEHEGVMSATKLSTQEQAVGLVNTAWSLARLEYADYPFMESMAAWALRLISEFDHQQISNTAWSFAKLCFAHRPLLDSIAAAAIRPIGTLNAQDLANTAWSFSRLGVAHLPLMYAISAPSIRTMGDFIPQNITNLAWSCATL